MADEHSPLARRCRSPSLDRAQERSWPAGDDAFDGLERILAALGGDGHTRMTDYLTHTRDLAVLIDPDQ